MNEELFNEAAKSNVLTKKLIDQLPEICKGEFLFLHYQSGFQGNCKT